MITVSYLATRYHLTCTGCGRTLATVADERGLSTLIDEMEAYHRCAPLPFDLPAPAPQPRAS